MLRSPTAHCNVVISTVDFIKTWPNFRLKALKLEAALTAVLSIANYCLQLV